VFFRKKGKFTDVEGYNRISRLIEDRQREMSEHVEPQDDFDEDSVLLTREPVSRERPGLRVPDEAPAVSAVRPVARAPEQSAPAQAGEADFSSSSSRASMPTAAMPSIPASVNMPVPDLGRAPAGGCLVAGEAVWEGKLVTTGNVRVEGTVQGEIETSATLYVVAKARIEGKVRARSMMLAGEVEGEVTCSDRLEILPGGSARGEIETASLVVHEGAFIDSRFQMRKAPIFS
jgi:cytoskeletal protein CcmA (bactofilin family)